MATPGLATITAPLGTEMLTSVDPGGAIPAQISLKNAAAFLTPSNGLTAATTQTLAAGTQLTLGLNVVATVANSGDAVKLPVMTAGQYCVVFNAGSNPMAVFPGNASGAIDGGSAAASVTLTNAKRAIFFANAANTITSAQLGVAAA